MHEDITEHIAKDAGYNRGYEDGMHRAWNIVGELIDYYKREKMHDEECSLREGRYQAALFAQMSIKMNRCASASELEKKSVPDTEIRYTHVRDAMYELDDNGQQFNQEYMVVTLPRDGENFMGPKDLAGKTIVDITYQAKTLQLRLDMDDGSLYPCEEHANNKLWFRLVYDGSWAGNGETYKSKRMMTMTKTELLKLADEAMVYTQNEHHCFLENLSYLKTDSNGVVELALRYGS